MSGQLISDVILGDWSFAIGNKDAFQFLLHPKSSVDNTFLRFINKVVTKTRLKNLTRIIFSISISAT